jgi:hypothetical protein
MLSTRGNYRMKFGWKHRDSPTPKRMKQLGDALLAAFGTTGLSLGVPQMFVEQPNQAYLIMALVFIGLAAAGKFLSTFFSTDEPKMDS